MGSDTDTIEAEVERVDKVGDTAPGLKVTLAVLNRAILFTGSIADMVLASALVDFIIAVALPLASVGLAG